MVEAAVLVAVHQILQAPQQVELELPIKDLPELLAVLELIWVKAVVGLQLLEIKVRLLLQVLVERVCRVQLPAHLLQEQVVAAAGLFLILVELVVLVVAGMEPAVLQVAVLLEAQIQVAVAAVVLEVLVLIMVVLVWLSLSMRCYEVP
jgi:hypothetical protein